MNIHIKTINHKDQRYETCGGYWFTDQGDLEIRISSMNNWKYESLIALHELYEALYIKSKGIPLKNIDEFDISFEEIRKLYPDIIGDMEPGDMIAAPYHHGHKSATIAERMLSVDLEVPWREYDKTVNKLSQ